MQISLHPSSLKWSQFCETLLDTLYTAATEWILPEWTPKEKTKSENAVSKTRMSWVTPHPDRPQTPFIPEASPLHNNQWYSELRDESGR